MSSQYTTSLKIQEIGNGEQSGIWGSTTNTNWTLIEQAVAGVQTITMANANYTLSNLNGLLDEARNMVLVVTGTNNTTYQVIAPLVSKMYVVTNNTSGGNAITIGASTGSVITIPNGTTAQVYCDGSTGFYSAQTGSAGNFTVNGNLTVTGNQADVGSFSAASISVSGAATFATSPTAPTPTTGDNTTKVATTAFVNASIAANPSVLTGSLLMWPTTSAPSGYLNCDGTAVSRSTYATLYGVIGTTFGTGDGSTTFNLPNYTNRMPYGTTIGTTGGSADAIVVSHTHTITDPQHSHLYSNSAGGSGGTLPAYPVAANDASLTRVTSSSSTGISINTTGSSGTNANLPPYLGINFIIKT
jgi:microcystin-dependent protein